MSGALGLGLGTAPSNEAKNLSNALNRERFVAEVEAELREQTAAAAARENEKEFIQAVEEEAERRNNAKKGGRRRKQTRRRRAKRAVSKSRKGIRV